MSDGLRAETVTISGHGGDEVEAYLAQPLAEQPHGSVVVIHHMPGYDEFFKEVVRKFAHHGYAAICPNLHYREAPGASPDDAAAANRAAGGVPDERLVGDVAGAANRLGALPHANGKIGVIGHCSGGRQAFLAAVSLPFDAAVDCYGAFVVKEPPAGSGMSIKPLIDRAENLSCPLLGLFGGDDKFPAPEEDDTLAAELKRLGKTFDFHVYEGAAHAFFNYNRPSYRPEAAVDGWNRIFDFFGRYLAA